MTATILPIPWAHSVSDFGSVWKWDTTAFEITVNGNERSVYYQIADKSANPGQPARPFADGTAATFEAAERLIRETIGKAYPPELGFLKFAGPYATTFQLGNGQRVDLGPFEGQRVKVTVAARDAEDQVYRGVAKVKHYDLILTDGDNAVRISPSFIVDITIDGARPGMQRPAAGQATVGAGGRTTQGRVEPGCNGRSGFMPGTVEHSGKPCPVHEESGRGLPPGM